MTFLVRDLVPILVVYSLVTSTPALAQSRTLDETLNGEARSAYESALTLFGGGDYQGALTEFARAHALSENPRLLWNMAVCERQQHHYANAALYIQRHLDDAKDLPPQERADAAETLAALEAYFSYVWVTDAPKGATVVVNQTVTFTAPLVEPLRLDLGSHTITVSKPGYNVRSQQIDAVGGGQIVLDASLTAAPTDNTPPSPAQLKITTDGSEDVVSVDGKAVGSHVWEGALTPGIHTVRVTGSGKITYESRVDLKANSTRTLHVALEDERSFTWYWLAGGTALAVAGMGGYLLLRPEEPNGPTGSLTTVYLP